MTVVIQRALYNHGAMSLLVYFCSHCESASLINNVSLETDLLLAISDPKSPYYLGSQDRVVHCPRKQIFKKQAKKSGSSLM